MSFGLRLRPSFTPTHTPHSTNSVKMYIILFLFSFLHPVFALHLKAVETAVVTTNTDESYTKDVSVSAEKQAELDVQFLKERVDAFNRGFDKAAHGIMLFGVAMWVGIQVDIVDVFQTSVKDIDIDAFLDPYLQQIEDFSRTEFMIYSHKVLGYLLVKLFIMFVLAPAGFFAGLYLSGGRPKPPTALVNVNSEYKRGERRRKILYALAAFVSYLRFTYQKEWGDGLYDAGKTFAISFVFIYLKSVFVPGSRPVFQKRKPRKCEATLITFDGPDNYEVELVPETAELLAECEREKKIKQFERQLEHSVKTDVLLKELKAIFTTSKLLDAFANQCKKEWNGWCQFLTDLPAIISSLPKDLASVPNHSIELVQSGYDAVKIDLEARGVDFHGFWRTWILCSIGITLFIYEVMFGLDNVWNSLMNQIFVS